MATPSTTLPHRAVSSIRTTTAGDSPASSSGNPRTPLRSVPNVPASSSFNSPSSLRAEDDILIIEFGARKLRVGFAGDAAPKGCVTFSPAQARRVGDLRACEVGFADDWRSRGWYEGCELWRGDVRRSDLGLVGDRMERGLSEAFNKYLLIDSRPRRVVAVLPSGVPIPFLATALDTLFNRFHAPSVSLVPSTIACAVAGGVRSALIVDMGWVETVVTGVYEYREVQSSRSVRAGKLLVENTHKLLASALGRPQEERDGEDEVEHVISFEECEEIVSRLVWCKPTKASPSPESRPQEGLATVTEQDESEHTTASPLSASVPGSTTTTVPLRSTFPPAKLEMTYDQLSTPAESTFFDSQHPPCFFDDHELPLPLLIYRSLLKLPMDVRAICMARIIFTGGCSNVLGLRGRIYDEVNQLIQTHGWDPVHGKGVEAYRTNPKLRRGSRQATGDGPTGVQQEGTGASEGGGGATGTGSGGGGGGGGGGGHEVDGVWVDSPAEAQQEVDPIEEQLRKKNNEKPQLQGQLRAIDSLGAWSGASLLNLLKVPALATVEKDVWREHGVNGASRPSEVDQKVAQRQSMGAGGLMRNAAAANWTLGVWGYL